MLCLSNIKNFVSQIVPLYLIRSINHVLEAIAGLLYKITNVMMKGPNKQETEIEKSFDNKLLRIPGFNLELENNSNLSRVGLYISSEINYKRQLSIYCICLVST